MSTQRRRALHRFPCLLLLSVLCAGLLAAAQPVSVLRTQGSQHGFLVVRSAEGKVIGHGEMSQTMHGDVLGLRLTLRFLDGSLDDESSTYTQAGHFHMVTDRHVQRGPFFHTPIDIALAANGRVTTRSSDGHGQSNTDSSQMDLPADLSNGMLPILLLNVPPHGAGMSLPFLAPFGKGRLIHLAVTPEATTSGREFGQRLSLEHLTMHLELGGMLGMLAPLARRQPKDLAFTLVGGDSPALLRMAGPLAVDGPAVSVEAAGSSFAPLTSASH